MGYDKSEYTRDCNICGTNYVYRITYDHDSFNYSYSNDYECPTCSKGLYVSENKEKLDKLKRRFKILVNNGEEYYNRLIMDENELIDKVTLILKKMPSYMTRQSSSDVVVSMKDGESVKEGIYYYRLTSCYKTKFGLKKDTIYKALVDSNLYNKSITAFKKEYKGVDAVDVFLSFYELTIEEYSKYLILNRSKRERTESYQKQYDELIELIEKAEKDYLESFNIYNKYHKKD
ncbi:hypothetical protein [Clostridium perfringens]|uniref:hypothetical protein n=1 Tax=Clostridium perfringens TaxID=1502 RepID=UPI0023F793C2|nr:hypothetical protein [Clostridium perfringens]WEV20053.1 hypothetical protein PL323_05315 [Clostridium perfringens D]